MTTLVGSVRGWTKAATMATSTSRRNMNVAKTNSQLYSSSSSSVGWWGVVDKTLLSDFEPNDTPFVALGDGYFALDRDGEPYWQGNLPRGFINKFWGRQRHLPRAEFAAFGPDAEQYFVQFSDGHQQWGGASDDFTKALRKSDSTVKTLAFAPDGGYYILFKDGDWEFFNLPLKLYHQLNGRQKSLPGVEHLTIGPNGEWFVRFEDGSWRCHGQSESCGKTIDELHAEGENIEHIAFGHDSTWLITYS